MQRKLCKRRRRVRVEVDVRALVLGLVLLAPGGASPAVHVALVAKPSRVVAGRAWTARLVVTPASYAGRLQLVAAGAGRFVAAAHGSHGSYRARLVFPRAGRWTLTAHAGAVVVQLGAIAVRAAAAPALRFSWPTSIDLQEDGSLLIVENGAGRIVRVTPGSKRVAAVASGLAKPYAVAHGADGRVYVSNDRQLERIVPGAAPEILATAAEQIGPLAVGSDGTVFFTTSSQVFAATGASPRAIARGLSNPHGIAVAADGSLLVSDTGNGRVVRADPATGAATTLFRTAQPRGLAVAADGTIVVVNGETKRLERYAATGTRIGVVGAPFRDPYTLAAARDGTLYVIETAASGTVVRIAPNGTRTTL
jgi:sugar lactone lactonase YvrE